VKARRPSRRVSAGQCREPSLSSKSGLKPGGGAARYRQSKRFAAINRPQMIEPACRLSVIAQWVRVTRTGMKSPVVKRSIVVAGRKTSVSLEAAFWHGLKDIASTRGMRVYDIVTTIDLRRQHDNLSSAIRLFVLDHYRNQSLSHSQAVDLAGARVE
jgi:predicted DNA-binding ribbon-helix-helix protein